MGLLEFSLTTTTPCEGQGSYYAFGYYQDEGTYHVERLPQASIGRTYEDPQQAEERVLKLYAFVKQLSAMAVAKLCDGDLHGCEEPALSLVHNVVYTLPQPTLLPIRPYYSAPMAAQGIHRSTPLSEAVERYAPTYDPTIFLPYPVDEAMNRPTNNVVQTLAVHGLSLKHPVYAALRGDEVFVERIPEQ